MGVVQKILNWLWPWRIANKALNQADASFKSYQKSREQEHLQAAIESYTTAYKNSGEVHDKYPTILINYGAALYESNKRFGGEQDQSEKVIELFNMALSIWERTTPRPKGYPTLLINLGNAYLEKYRTSKAKADFTSAIETYKKARNLPDVVPIILIKSYIGLGIARWTYCELLDPGQAEGNHLDTAISDLNEALKEVAKLSDEKGEAFWNAECFRNLASAYDVRHTRHPEQLDDLDSAIKYNKSALEEMSGHAVTQFNLAKQYFARYHATGRNANDLKEAEENLDEVRELMETDEEAKQLGPKIDELTGKIEQYRNRTDTVWSTTSADPEPAIHDGHGQMTDAPFTMAPQEDLATGIGSG